MGLTLLSSLSLRVCRALKFTQSKYRMVLLLFAPSRLHAASCVLEVISTCSCIGKEESKNNTSEIKKVSEREMIARHACFCLPTMGNVLFIELVLEV